MEQNGELVIVKKTLQSLDVYLFYAQYLLFIGCIFLTIFFITLFEFWIGCILYERICCRNLNFCIYKCLSFFIKNRWLYMIYQETFGVYKLRSLFFKTLIYYFGMRKNLAFKEVVRRNSFKTYIWDVFFILSLIVVIYILSNNIRIII